MAVQLTLGVTLRDEVSFDGFIADGNGEIVETLRRIGTAGGEQFVFIWGASGSGKTHLLQAVCHHLAAQNSTSTYLPLAQVEEFSSSMLTDLESLDAVCVDDIQRIAGNSEWESGFFHLYNRLRERGNAMVVTAIAPPNGLKLVLRDLTSRLNWGLVMQLTPLSDEAKLSALCLRARQRGLELKEDVGRYLLRYHRRDLPALFALLDRLDRASLTAQRRLTIPFVKKVINDDARGA